MGFLATVRAACSRLGIFRSENFDAKLRSQAELRERLNRTEYRWSDNTRLDMLDHLQADLKAAMNDGRSHVEIHDLNLAIQKCQRLWNIRSQ